MVGSDDRVGKASLSRTGRRASRLLWGLIGGFAGLMLYVVSLSIYACAGWPSEGSGLLGAFHAHWIAILLVIGTAPAFLIGATAGAVAARHSFSAAAISATGVAIASFLVGVAIFLAFERSSERTFQAEMEELDRQVAEADQMWLIFLSMDGRDLLLINSPPTPGIPGPLKPDLPPEVIWKFGESGVALDGDPGPPWVTLTVAWPQPDMFEAVFDFKENETEETRIEAWEGYFTATATLDGAPIDFPVVVGPADHPQEVVVRGTIVIAQ